MLITQSKPKSPYSTGQENKGMNRKIIGAAAAAATMLMLTCGSALAPVAHAHKGDDPQPVGPTGQTYNLVFRDEFDGSSLDLTKWSDSWVNGGKQNNVPTSAANVAVSGGNVTLTLTGTPGNYVGASINTDPLQNWTGSKVGFTFTTGVTEWRVKFPGDGTTLYNWSGAWQPTDPYLGEIDSVETMGTAQGHYHPASDVNPNLRLYDAGYLDGWHTYTMQRTATNILMWIDGRLVSNYPVAGNPDVQGGYPVTTPQYLVANIGIGDTPSQTGPAGAVVIDYIRVWSES
jgi:Glycosyl hydrolases family 16